MAVLTVRVMQHLMEAIIAHMQPILMVPLVLAKDLAWAEDLAGVEEWEEDVGKPDCIGISFFQTG